MKPVVDVLYTPGTNCHVETLSVFRALGAQADLLFSHDIAASPELLDRADILAIPGGYAYGDHLGAGRIAAIKVGDQVREALARRPRPVVAICNGFQIAVRSGLFGPGVDLVANASGRFANVPDQPHQVAADNDSIWLEGLGGQTLVFPCAHGEGQWRYDADRTPQDRGWRTALTYPAGANPDGSADDIAGVTSTDGLVLGMMDHPERSIDPAVRFAFFERGLAAVHD